MRQNNHAFLLFLAGLFSLTRINLGGSIAITEIVMVMLLPFVFIRNFKEMRRDGLGTLITLCLLWIAGAVFSDCWNGTYIKFALKGIATPIVYLSGIVCIYALLRKCPLNFRWYLLGAALSYVISTFVFQRAASLDDATNTNIADSVVERTISYKLYWVVLADHFILLPVRGWFASTPFIYSCVAVLGMACGALLLGARSMLLSFVASFVFIFVGGSTTKNLNRLKKHIFVVVLLLLSMLAITRVVYKEFVTRGMLGEGERRKYEYQSRGGDSVLKMLMSGRSEFFVGIFAAKDRPIIGRGSWALDHEEIWPEFVRKYGSQEDYERMIKYMQSYGYCRHIPFHTHIVTYWMWHGIFGLMFWSYVLWIIIQMLRKGMYADYRMFGYFSLAIPMFVWDLFFSPVGVRVYESMLLVLCLFSLRCCSNYAEFKERRICV